MTSPSTALNYKHTKNSILQIKAFQILNKLSLISIIRSPSRMWTNSNWLFQILLQKLFMLCSSKRQGSLQNITFNDYPAPLQIAKTTSLTILHKQCYHQITNLLTHTTKHLDAHTCDLAVPQDIWISCKQLNKEISKCFKRCQKFWDIRKELSPIQIN